MAINFIFQRLMDQAIADGIIQDGSNKARLYFQQKAKETEDSDLPQVDNLFRRKSLVDNYKELPFKPGDIFLFRYDPKNKNKNSLPYYDRFPVSAIIDVTPTYCLGLNFHYLPYRERGLFMKQLLEFRDENILTDKTYLDIDYDKVRSTGTSKLYYKACIKKYLNNHIRGRMIKIHPEEWQYVISLPLQDFRKVPNVNQVWEDSRLKWNGKI